MDVKEVILKNVDKCLINVDYDQLNKDLTMITNQALSIPPNAQIDFLLQPQVQQIVNQYAELINSLENQKLICLTQTNNTALCGMAKSFSSFLSIFPDITKINQLLEVYGVTLQKTFARMVDRIDEAADICQIKNINLDQLKRLYTNIHTILHISNSKMLICPKCITNFSCDEQVAEGQNMGKQEGLQQCKKDEQQKWLIYLGGTVLVALLLGYIIGRMIHKG